MSRRLVSIVLPTRNGMPHLARVLNAVATQQVNADVEIVAIDTASTDGTTDLLRARVTHLIQLEAGAFNHGDARNEAIAVARGELVVIMSQDAEPAHDRWLHALIEPFDHDSRIAGTYARQQYRPSAGAIARRYHSNWIGSSAASRVSRIASRDAFEMLPPAEQLQLCTFDNVCSCIRRDVWECHPFKRTPIAEDLEWSRDVLLAGYEIRYVPDAVVLHSHARSARYEFRRTAALHQRLYTLFGLRTIPTPSALARAVASTTRLHLRCRREAPPGCPVESVSRALALAVAWPLGQYVGARRAAAGLPPLESPDV